jgi:hypothetical protein
MMRQYLDIIVQSSVDTGQWLQDQPGNEARLLEAIQRAVISVTNGDTEVVELEYGEPL